MIEQVHSLDLAALRPYRTLRRPEDHLKDRIFVAEGEKVVRRLLTSGLTVRSLLVTPERFGNLEREGIPVPAEVTIYMAEKTLLETIVGYSLHQGIMAVAQVPDEPSIDSLFDGSDPPYVAVALDGLVNSENVGVIVRNSAAFGIRAVLVGETSSSPYLRRAVRNSMGAVFHTRVYHSLNLRDSLIDLRQRFAMRVVAAHPAGEARLGEADMNGNICVILGNEGNGVSSSLLEISDRRISIPMADNVDSLNVASASAVFFYEIAKARSDGGGRRHVQQSEGDLKEHGT